MNWVLNDFMMLSAIYHLKMCDARIMSVTQYPDANGCWEIHSEAVQYYNLHYIAKTEFWISRCAFRYLPDSRTFTPGWNLPQRHLQANFDGKIALAPSKNAFFWPIFACGRWRVGAHTCAHINRGQGTSLSLTVSVPKYFGEKMSFHLCKPGEVSDSVIIWQTE